MRLLRPGCLCAAGILSLFFLSAPARAQSHPLRLTVGLDSSRNEGITGGNDFEARYQRGTGAFQVGASFDVYSSRAVELAKLIGFVYADLNIGFVGGGNNTAYGLGLRLYPVPRIGAYGGVGIGLYDRAVSPDPGDDGLKVGLKLSLGYETRGPFFVEANLTLIDAKGYQASPAFLLGIRL